MCSPPKFPRRSNPNFPLAPPNISSRTAPDMSAASATSSGPIPGQHVISLRVRVQLESATWHPASSPPPRPAEARAAAQSAARAPLLARAASTLPAEALPLATPRLAAGDIHHAAPLTPGRRRRAPLPTVAPCHPAIPEELHAASLPANSASPCRLHPAVSELRRAPPSPAAVVFNSGVQEIRHRLGKRALDLRSGISLVEFSF